MYLAKLQIRNFRGIMKGDFNISQHFMLLGSNNSGKSTVIDAIGLLLGKESLVRNIGDYDFYGGNPSASDRILIKGLLAGFNTNDINTEADWFNNNNGGIPKWLDTTSNKVFSEQNSEKSLKLAIEIGFAARFDKEELEFETKQFFVNGDVVEPQDLISQLKMLLVLMAE
jgi:putative ATP-dependent endonuclease of the OLD family